MQRLTITLMNLYDADPTLLDNLVLPEQIVRDDFIGRLMIDIGESEVCITNPHIMKIAIGVWSRGRLPVWNRLAAVQDLEYNPIWNVDGETVHTGSTSNDRSYDRDRSYSRGRSDSTESTETVTGQLSADNVETWSNDTKSVSEGETSGQESITDAETITDGEKQSGSDKWTEKRTGNIGVTTTQKMMTEEVEFWESYDIIKYIINQFAKEFCLLVY